MALKQGKQTMVVRYDYPMFDNMSLVLNIVDNPVNPLISAINQGMFIEIDGLHTKE